LTPCLIWLKRSTGCNDAVCRVLLVVVAACDDAGGGGAGGIVACGCSGGSGGTGGTREAFGADAGLSLVPRLIWSKRLTGCDDAVCRVLFVGVAACDDAGAGGGAGIDDVVAAGAGGAAGIDDDVADGAGGAAGIDDVVDAGAGGAAGIDDDGTVGTGGGGGGGGGGAVGAVGTVGVCACADGIVNEDGGCEWVSDWNNSRVEGRLDRESGF